ncbi:MAG: hypothetical protein LBH44_06435 [Treponema sp.]|jgi:hypothetical protein|nr:hypothetical protein [Treponema sp.]
MRNEDITRRGSRKDAKIAKPCFVFYFASLRLGARFFSRKFFLSLFSFVSPRLCVQSFRVILFLLLANSNLLFAESEFSFSLAPVIEAPLGIEQFTSGMGAAASLDWAFWQFAKNFDLGFRAGGGFTSVTAQIGDPLTLIEGRLGPFVRWQPRVKSGALDRWAFNAGMGAGVYSYSRSDYNSETKALFSFNMGGEFRLLPYLSLFAEGTYTHRVFDPPQPLSSVGMALGVRLNLSEIMGGRARVQVEKTEQYRVFPVSYAWYEHNPIAKVKITNEEPNDITDVTLSFFMDSYMSQPWTFATLPRLSQGESVEVPLTALFNDVMINLLENVNAAGIIQTQYRSLGAKKESVSVVQMPIFHRNAFSWEDDRRAAAFVSPRDFSALFFARYVAGAVGSEHRTESSQTMSSEQLSVNRGLQNVPANVRYAAAMFEALRLYGMSYVVVPATSYKNLSANEAALDSVSYPYQALYYRGGDCTYLSILFCSLLEAIKIETAFITIPGHLYIAFEVGDSNWQKGNADIIEIETDGALKRWLPVEITVPDQGFTRAWRIGAREWRANVTAAEGSAAALYPIREAWKLYPPVTIPASGDHPPEMPDRFEIIKAMEAELRK